MKKLIYGLISLMAISCTPKSSSSSDASQKTPATLLTSSKSSLYAVPLDTAIKNIQRYNKDIKIYDSLVAVAEGKKPSKKVPMKGFTIRAADLLQAMGMPVADTTQAAYKNIRVYLALNHKREFKLYLTPVDSANLGANPPQAGKDIILHGDFFKLGGTGDYVLDFTQPCPTTCPTSSPLAN